jgi:LuxR family transcriptional regulator, maltose regulon positive regulatory protein
MADRWADVMERRRSNEAARAADPLADAESLLAQAFLCRHGVEQMCADADEAVVRLDAMGIVAPGAQFCQGVARILMGEVGVGQARLEEAIRLGTEHAVPEVVSHSLCQQALLAEARGDGETADELTAQAATALREVGLEDGLVEALLARAAMRRGDVATGSRHLSNAQRLLPVMNYGHPFLAVQTRLELARIHLNSAPRWGHERCCGRSTKSWRCVPPWVPSSPR